MKFAIFLAALAMPCLAHADTAVVNCYDLANDHGARNGDKICVNVTDETEYDNTIVTSGPTYTAHYEITATDSRGATLFQKKYTYSEGDCGAGNCGEAFANTLNDLQNASASARATADEKTVVFSFINGDIKIGQKAGEVFYAGQSYEIFMK